MEFSGFDPADTQETIAFFARVFAASADEEEGRTIGELVTNLIATTASPDLVGFFAKENDEIVGGIFFSRMVVPGGQRTFVLSPVAVATERQGTGVGQQLISHGLDKMREAGVELVFTYGDPRYYCKTGFKQIAEAEVAAPYPLSMPFGWQAQCLDGSPVPAMEGPTQCVSAFCDPKYW